ncbi:Protein of unknown function [Gryllus bimaculatus]|nr:Protein of unknown function [Gryllus bimaculatus]
MMPTSPDLINHIEDAAQNKSYWEIWISGWKNVHFEIFRKPAILDRETQLQDFYLVSGRLLQVLVGQRPLRVVTATATVAAAAAAAAASVIAAAAVGACLREMRINNSEASEMFIPKRTARSKRWAGELAGHGVASRGEAWYMPWRRWRGVGLRGVAERGGERMKGMGGLAGRGVAWRGLVRRGEAW